MRLIDADVITDHEIIDYLGISHASCLPDVRDLLDEQPTIEAVPVVHGFNDNQNYHEADEFRCSECGLHLEDWCRTIHDEETREEYFVEYVFKYCPECGAKMKGGAE